MPGAQRVIEYHLIARGSCWGHAVGQEPMRLEEGDLLVLPQGDAHVLSSAPGMRAEPDMSKYARRELPLPLLFELGGGGKDKSRIVCCFLGCDERPYNPLLTALPAVIHLPAKGAAASTGWLSTMMKVAVDESRQERPGIQNVLSRLSELLFVETIRRYLETLPPAEKGWLAGLRDPLVGQALAALHRDPKQRWTVQRLARVVGALALGVGRTLHGDGRPAADAIPRAVADAARLALVERGQPGGRGRRGGWLRFRSGVQPRVQEARRPVAGRVAGRRQAASERRDVTWVTAAEPTTNHSQGSSLLRPPRLVQARPQRSGRARGRSRASNLQSGDSFR
jgi:hypothetical protein